MFIVRKTEAFQVNILFTNVELYTFNKNKETKSKTTELLPKRIRALSSHLT